LNSSRKPIVAGNWKMFHGDRSGAPLAAECVKIARAAVGVQVVIAPPFTALAACAAECLDSPLELAAQDIHPQEQGPCTGEIGAETVKGIGCAWVIIGHSERRHILAETDEMVVEKLDAALLAGLKPIVCVGETLAQRDAGRALRVLRLQVEAVSPLLSEAHVPVAIAYEPVWAIGTGKNASPVEVEQNHLAIRAWLGERNAKLARAAHILYGGSVRPENAASLLACANVDGALIGGASLEADSFGAIAMAASGLPVAQQVGRRSARIRRVRTRGHQRKERGIP
jgi:triosephosphate isomerase (TIM)